MGVPCSDEDIFDCFYWFLFTPMTHRMPLFQFLPFWLYRIHLTAYFSDRLYFFNFHFYKLTFLPIELFINGPISMDFVYIHPFLWADLPVRRISSLFFRRTYFNRLFYNQTLLWTDDRHFFINWSFSQQTLLPISTDNFFQQIILPTDIICELTNLNWQLCQPTPKLFFRLTLFTNWRFSTDFSSTDDLYIHFFQLTTIPTDLLKIELLLYQLTLSTDRIF